MDHRRVRGLRPGRYGPLALERGARRAHRGPALRAVLLPARHAKRAPRPPEAHRDSGRCARGPRGRAAHRSRGRRHQARPRDHPAALPRLGEGRAHPRLEWRLYGPSSLRRRLEVQPALRDRARHLPHGPRAVRERRVARRRGALRLGLSAAAAAAFPPGPPCGQSGGHAADAGHAPRGARGRCGDRRERGGHPPRHRRGRALEGPGHPDDGWRGRVRHAVPRAKGRGARREPTARARRGQVRGEEGKVLLHVREDRLQAGAVHPARTSPSGPRALRVPGERLRGARGTVAVVDPHAAGAGTAHAGHGDHRDAGEPGPQGRLPCRMEEEPPGGVQECRVPVTRRPRRVHLRTRSRIARGALRTRLLCAVSEHHGEVQHFTRDIGLQVL